CYDLTNTPPYGLWLDLFDDAALDPTLPPAPAGFEDGRLDDVSDQAALFADVRAYLAALAAARPTLILLEDIHWADPASLDLLRHVASRLRRWPMLVLATYRGDELTRLNPLSQQLPALARAADGARLDVRRVDVEALRALVAARYRLSAADEARLVDHLDQRADGNPFFATEILRALQEEGLLRPAGDVWSLGALHRASMPSFLRQVIDGRVARLGDDTREPLAIAAVIGHEVPLALWGEVAGLDEESLLAIVERAVDAHLLETAPDGDHVRFIHALTREALYAGMLPPRRRRWHDRVAESIAAGERVDPDAVAFHFQQAADSRAVEWLIKAGDRAQRAYAWLTAADRFQSAATLLAGIEGKEIARDKMLRRVAYLKRFSDPAGALAAIDEAGRLATRRGDAVAAAEARWVRGMLLVYLDRFRSGIAEMGAGYDALAAMPGPAQGPRALQAWMAAAMPAASAAAAVNEPAATRIDAADQNAWRTIAINRYAASAGHTAAVIDACEPFIDAFEPTAEPQSGMRALLPFTHHALGIAYASRGQPAASRRAFARAHAIFAEFDHHAMMAFTFLNELRDVALTYDTADPGRRRRLSAEAEAALARTAGALRTGVTPRLAWLGCHVLDGDWHEVDRIFGDLPSPGHSYLRRELTATRAVLARWRGEPETAWAEIRALLPAGPATEPGDIIQQEGLFLLRLAADLCLDDGDVAAARAWLTGHNRWLDWNGAMLGRAEGRLAWGRLHYTAGDATAAAKAAREALTLAAAPAQPLVALAAERLLGELATAADRRGEAAARLTAALDLAADCEAPFERALTLVALVKLHLANGQTEEAGARLHDARTIFHALRAVPLLALSDALAARIAHGRQ
ncbi:MAG TPA: hypothetical protein VFQ80_11750, partial [Thermomicrobiales bacterium]|nr:hypothetical protein [Thermomicrobiales bacterium]